MRTFSKWLAGAVLALLLGASLTLLLALEASPRVGARDDVSPADIDRAVAMARQHDPRQAPPGQLHRVPLRERDVDLLLQHAAQRWLAANTRVRLEPGRLIVLASRAGPFGRWLNLELELRQTAALPQIERLRLGSLPLPTALAIPLLQTVASRHGVQAEALLAVEWIERVTFAKDQLTVSYRFAADTTSRLRSALVAPADQQRLRAYAERLAALTRDIDVGEVAVARLLVPLFALAAERSAGSDDAVAENRAALLAVTFYANQRPLGLIVPAAYSWPTPRPLRVTLQRRDDFALHFLISAVIAAEAGTPLADAVGLWKELADARQGGSGFSFNDLAADRAGARFGDLAVRAAQRLQARIAASGGEADFMVDASDLPEFLPETEFVARYGGVGGTAYNRLLAEIEARVDALPLFR
ncbi:MAG: hypothetical protein ABIQ60_08195 [Burkholderiaceae bacterium]